MQHRGSTCTAGLAALSLVMISAVAFGQAPSFQPTYEPDTARSGQDYRNFRPLAPSALYCQQACLTEEKCRAWAYDPPERRPDKQPMCWLKSGVPAAKKVVGIVSGVVRPEESAAAPPAPPTSPAPPSAATAAPAVLPVAAAPQGKVISCTVASGPEQRCTSHMRIDGQRRDHPVTINLTVPPANGKVVTRVAEEDAKLNDGTTARARATVIFYQSNAGFVGQDSFTYTRTTDDPRDSSNGTYTMSVTVK